MVHYPQHMTAGKLNKRLLELCGDARLCDEQEVSNLLDAGADVSASRGKVTALHLASERGHSHIVSLLIRRGANVEEEAFGSKYTPCHLATTDASRVLLQEGKASVTARDKNGWTPLHHAAQYGMGLKIGLLLDNGAQVDGWDGYPGCKNIRTPLHRAAAGGGGPSAALKAACLDAAAVLLSRGASIDAQDKDDGEQPLHVACRGSNTAMVELFLQHGADVNAEDKKGVRALHWACLMGHADVVALLLRQKAIDVDSRDQMGRAAVHWATQGEQKTDVLRLLLDKEGADVNALSKSSGSALHRASYHSQHEAVVFLVDRGADLRVKDAEGKTAKELATNPSVAQVLEGKEEVEKSDDI